MNKSTVKIDAFGGLERNAPKAAGNLRRSPDLLNVVSDESGLLKKRDGYEKLFDAVFGEGPVDGLFWNEQSGSLIIFCAGKMYAARENEAPELLMEGLTPGPVTSFVMQKRQFFLNGHEYLVLEGRAVHRVRDVAYVPTVAEKSYTMDGTGDYDVSVRAEEPVNLLTLKFRERHVVEQTYTSEAVSYLTLMVEVDDASTVRLYDQAGHRLTHGWSMHTTSQGIVDRITISGGMPEGRTVYIEAERKATSERNVFKAYFSTEYLTYDGMETDGVTVHIGDQSFNTVQSGTYNWMQKFYDEHHAAIAETGYTLEVLEETVNVSPGNSENKDIRCLKFTYEKEDYPPRIWADAVGGKDVFYVFQSEFKSPNKTGCIEKCRFGMAYGGRNDTRVFVSGNEDMPNRDWMSGLYDPTYFPDDGYTDIGRDDEGITGYANLFEEMVVFKENSIWGRSFGTYESELVFPLRPIHESVGLSATRTLKMIKNMPVGLLTSGVGALSGTNVKDERNVDALDEALGSAINKDPDAFSEEYKDYYLVKSGDDIYVLNYKLGEWYRWRGIPASCFLVHGDALYFGGEDGCCYRMTPEKYLDDTRPIEAYWRSKELYLGSARAQKLIEKIYVCFLNGEGSSLTLRYRDSEGQWQNILGTNEFPKPEDKSALVPDVAVARVKQRKVTHFQFELRNEFPGENMPVLSAEIVFGALGSVRI